MKNRKSGYLHKPFQEKATFKKWTAYVATGIGSLTLKLSTIQAYVSHHRGLKLVQCPTFFAASRAHEVHRSQVSAVG